jgi:glycosyltransferase involved in cell wall biosynthesis
MRISAVVCTFRQPKTLPAAIESLLAQSLPPELYEIIVVDNNSRDETVEIVEHYVRTDGPKVEYVLETRQGLSHARNNGVHAAASDIVAFLDDDAVASSEWLASLLEIYDSIPDAWAVGGKVLPIWDGERPNWIEDTMFRSLSLVDWGNEKRPLKWPERIIGTNCSFRKRVFSEIGLFATNLGRRGKLLLGNEDTEIQERIHKLRKMVFYTPQAVVYHCVSRKRMSKTYFYRRDYGGGRSDAILMARHHSYNAVLMRAGKIIGHMLPKQCLWLAWSIMGESARFCRFRKIAYYFGFLHQAMGLLLTKWVAN